MRFDEHGRELPDDTPIAKPVRFNRPGSTLDEIRRNLDMANRLAQEQGLETFDEADDFQIGDDFEENHPWAEQIDNMNREFEEIRNKVREARLRGEIEVTEDGRWYSKPKAAEPSRGVPEAPQPSVSNAQLSQPANGAPPNQPSPSAPNNPNKP
ncbi:hypothetical protein [Apis mellifera associated microvirus 40]|nr:hypothetical protein [Apis mellifera associated microvirus 40]